LVIRWWMMGAACAAVERRSKTEAVIRVLLQ
jgi:hypothetical protein